MDMINRFGQIGAVASVSVALLVLLVVAVLPAPTHAQFSDDGGCCSSYAESIDWSYPTESYPSYAESIDWSYPAYYETESYPSYAESIDWSYPAYYNNSSYAESIDWSYPASYNNSSYAESIDWSYAASNPSYAESIDWAYPGYDAYDVYSVYDVYDVYEGGVKYSYNPGYSTPSCTSCGGFGGGSSFGRGGGFSVSPPTYTPSRPTPQPPVVVPPTKSNATTNVHTNTCTHGSCNTNVNNIDNSINGSFNTNTAPVTPVYTLPPQQLVQYVPPMMGGGVCVITASPSNIQNGQAAILNWNSMGPGNAWLSDGIGHVAPVGTLAVRPNVSTNYVLTVNGPQGPRTCNVFVNVSGSYVSLTQIPYTGFDLGTIGNAAYWAGLLSFALAAAYLVVYYQGGMGSFVPSFAGMVKLPKLSVAKREEEETGETLAAPALFSKQYVAREITPVVRKAQIDNLPTTRTVNAPKDAMTLENGRIVVSRN